jgi:uncharacterized membrane protein YfcA
VNTTTVAVGTGAVVVAGRWANQQPIDIKTAIGVGAYAVCLSVLSAADAKMANSLAFIVFFVACAYYVAPSEKGPGLVSKLGFSGTAGG